MSVGGGCHGECGGGGCHGECGGGGAVMVSVGGGCHGEDYNHGLLLPGRAFFPGSVSTYYIMEHR